jgi:hypothetical protein
VQHRIRAHQPKRRIGNAVIMVGKRRRRPGSVQGKSEPSQRLRVQHCAGINQHHRSANRLDGRVREADARIGDGEGTDRMIPDRCRRTDHCRPPAIRLILKRPQRRTQQERSRAMRIDQHRHRQGGKFRRWPHRHVADEQIVSIERIAGATRKLVAIETVRGMSFGNRDDAAPPFGWTKHLL